MPRHIAERLGMAIYRQHRIAVVALAALMALQLASRVFDLGSVIAEGSYRAVMASAAAAVVVRAVAPGAAPGRMGA